MSYEPTNWKDGDLVTSAKLNKIEQGIAAGGGVLIVNGDENGRLDRTWQEIYDANICFLLESLGNNKTFAYISTIGLDNNNTYIAIFYSPIDDNTLAFVSSSPDDYPTFQTQDSQG